MYVLRFLHRAASPLFIHFNRVCVLVAGARENARDSIEMTSERPAEMDPYKELELYLAKVNVSVSFAERSLHGDPSASRVIKFSD